MSDQQPGDDPSSGWERFPNFATDRRELVVWRSTASHDPKWDEFLVASSLGQFQQSSAWARIKREEGWDAARLVVTDGGRVVAGFQILWKTKFGIRFGYVSKGPVVLATPGFGPVDAIGLLRCAARHLGLWGLIVQPPDFAREFGEIMSAAGFLENRLQTVFDATVVVELADQFADVEKRYSQSTRKQLRKATNAGITTYIGSSAEADRFFELMVATCRRQGVKPNPSHPTSLRRILDEMNLPGNTASAQISAHILFVEMGGTTLAGLLFIRFGETVSLWKMGWNGAAEHLNAPKLLYHESLRWAVLAGCRRGDLVGFDRATAKTILEDKAPREIAMKSTDVLKLRFGGKPVLLPQARIWIRSYPARVAYQMFLKFYRKK